MIEALNAVVSNSQLVRAVAEQTSSSNSFAANPTRVQSAAVTAPYLSPHVDLSGGSKPIFVVRDLETGQHIRQFPTEAQIRAYQTAANQANARAQAQSIEYKSQQSSEAQKSIDIAKSSVEFRAERQAIKTKQEAPAVATGGGSSESKAVKGYTRAVTSSSGSSSLDTEV